MAKATVTTERTRMAYTAHMWTPPSRTTSMRLKSSAFTPSASRGFVSALGFSLWLRSSAARRSISSGERSRGLGAGLLAGPGAASAAPAAAAPGPGPAEIRDSRPPRSRRRPSRQTSEVARPSGRIVRSSFNVPLFSTPVARSHALRGNQNLFYCCKALTRSLANGTLSLCGNLSINSWYCLTAWAFLSSTSKQRPAS